jgi:hypothetical protein
MGEKKRIQGACGKPEGKKLLPNIGIGGRIILKGIFTKWDGGAWTGLIWLRTTSVNAIMNFRVP